MMDNAIATFKGIGTKAELYENKLVIKKSFFFGNKEKTIFLSQLAGIVMKKQGLTNPAIHFALANSQINDKKIFNNKDDNTIPFLAQSSKSALEFKAAVENHLSKTHSFPSK